MENVRVNLAPLLRFGDAVARDLRGGGNGPIRAALKQWAAIYRAFLQERFDRLSKSGGGGEWAPLARSTIMRRRTGKSVGRFKKDGKPATQGQRIRFLEDRTKRSAAGLTQKADRITDLRKQGKAATKAFRAAVERFAKAEAKTLKQASSAKKESQSILASGTVSILRDTGLLFNAVNPAFSGKPGQLQEDIPFGVRVGFGGPGRHPDGTATIADIASFHQEGGPHLPQRKIVVPPDDSTTRKMADVMQRAMDKMAGGAA